MARFAIAIACFAFLLAGTDAVGIRQKRMLAAAEDEEQDPVPKAKAKGEKQARKQGIRQLLQETDNTGGSSSSNGFDRDLPLNKHLIDEWGKGKMSSGQLQKIALKASAQGAHG